MIWRMFNFSIANLFDASGSQACLAALNLSETAVWSAGILAACGIIWMASVWVARILQDMRLKRGPWISATAELTDRSIEVRPVNFLRHLTGKACKVVRKSYCYTYEVDGVPFQGTATIVENVDMAYNAKTYAKRSAAASHLPIRYLESSPQISTLSTLNQATSLGKAIPSRRPIVTLQILIACVGVMMILFSAWRVVAWQYRPSTQIVAVPDSSVINTSDIRSSKITRSFVGSKKSSVITADRLTPKR